MNNKKLLVEERSADIGNFLVGRLLPRYLFWNFVSSSKERLQQAKKDWENKRFPKVPNDDTYIPLPKQRKP